MRVADILEVNSDESSLAEQRANLFNRNKEAVGGIGGPAEAENRM